MATRLKNIRFSNWFKLLAILIGISGVVLSFYGAIRYPDFSYGLHSDYKKSKILEEEIRDISTNILRQTQLKSAENIKTGAVINDDKLKNKIEDIKNERNHAILNITEEYKELVALNDQDNPNELQRVTAERDEKIANAKQDYDKKIAGAKDELIAEELIEYNKAKRYLEEYEGLYYTVVPNSTVSGKDMEFYKTLPYYTKSSDVNDGILYIGFSEDAFTKQVTQYDVRHKNGLIGAYMLLSGVGMIFLSIAWLMYSAGRTPNSGELQFNFFDKVYLDIGLLITGAIAMFSCFIATILEIKMQNLQLVNLLSLLILVIAYFSIAAYAMMFAKRVKSGGVVKHTLMYKVFKSIKAAINKMIDTTLDLPTNNQVFAKKAIGFLLLYTVLLGMIGLLFVILAAGMHVIIGLPVALVLFALLLISIVNVFQKRVSAFITLAEGIKKIKQGDFNHKIPACGFDTIDTIAEDINNIADGVKAAVDREMKAEHMKVELITNVSHDLKTPLTSIITYSDLLSQENIDAEQVKEYVEILQRKSVRLKQLVDDLFEVSKAQSGSISLQLEELCLNDLITQSLAEYEEDFKKARLDTILNLPPDKIMVLADGAKMWRVLSNLYNNAIKYSMSGTRVFVDVEVVNDKVNITMKNIANYIMHFTSEEIFERFKRGDESRSGEGSGLGLAIVRSFMALQKGSSDVVIDGDLFKVTLTLRK
ncbi:sensor histidine kinase [Pelosinus baikalensis]|uniref:histidine kinase n=1 Tax=Pelosinus baikalensis TaxID=2892015 RepID=A0ABS8HXM3_9FIRM|nr:HAMP domain-containing sensor histidine kinase [Pelosinus baikalensis]MCC5466892.1 HAMP domain-containing histidine kinase [Pelosinus baikalensis]